MGSVKRGHGPSRGKRGMRRYIVGGMVVVVLALFSAVVWFAYQDLMPGGDSTPPLIRADAGELKREPDERGGLPVVNAESAVVQALDEPESPVRVERILPREATAPRSTADVIPEALEAEPGAAPGVAAADELAAATDGAPLTAEAGEATDTLDTLLAEIIEGPEELGAIEPAAGPMAEDEIAALDSLPLPADGLALPETAAESPEAPATPTTAATEPAAPVQPREPAVTAAAPAPATPAPTPSPVPQTTTSAAPPAASAAAPAASPPPPAAPAETTVAALPSPALAATFDGAFRVQLLAVRDEAAAAGAWAGLQQRFPDALGPLRSQVQRAEIGGGTFYRLHAGPFADRSGALAVCEALQARGADCFVVAPTS